ncbi:MAG: CRISPR-associated endonuclease Cas3'' [Acidimicrobiales bacterium]
MEQSFAPPVVKARQVVESLDPAPVVDLGPQALDRVLTPARRRELATEPTLAPVVLGPALEAWARTSPTPEPDQAVAPYLHGVVRAAAEVLVCWRAGLPSPNGDLEAWQEELRTAPVTGDETLLVPLWEARRFLAGRDVPIGPLSDLEGAPEPDDDLADLEEREPLSAVVVTVDGQVRSADRRSLRPGTTLVLRSEDGGHDEWGWTGQSGDQPVPDVADLVLHGRGRLRLRWRPEVIGVERLPNLPDDDSQGPTVALGEALAELREEQLESGISSLVGDLCRRLAEVGRPVRAADRGPDQIRWWILEARRSKAPDPATKDDDEVSTSGSLQPVSLRRHLWDVARRAEEQARLLGLAPSLVRSVELAGRAHDLGKADPRFQAMLHGGEELRALAAPEPLAKSGMDPTDGAAFRRARQRSRWPRGMPHEAISAALVAELHSTRPDLFDGVDAELVHHLVQSHHGRARPLLPPLVDDDPQAVRVGLPVASCTDAEAEGSSHRDLVDWEGPSRFARLGRRYGWWGLALLEAIVRLADIEASAEYQQGPA